MYLQAFEHTSNLTPTTPDPQNLLLFVGGLYDKLFSIPYTESIAHSLPPTWSLAQVLLSSSGYSWGTSSLAKDVTEISACIDYFKAFKKGKVILMGSSTGCQDVMEYLTGKGHEARSLINGGILQAPVSDRESIVKEMTPDAYRTACEVAKKMVAEGHGEDILPARYVASVVFCPVTAYRFLSQASPDHNGDDDYFSTDLTDEQLTRSFGALPQGAPICVLFSGKDEYMSESIDKVALLARWVGIVEKGEGKVDEESSGVIEGASHNLAGNPEEVISALVKRIIGFVDGS
jgi:hypothetical protein